MRNHNVTEDIEWPTGALLGFVTVEDVLPQDDYREKYPEGMSSSPYVFICSDVVELDVKIPTRGDHKLWKLPKSLHESARSQLNL